MKEGVETHELDAGIAVERFFGHFLEGKLEDVFGMLIPVMPGVAKKRAIFREKREINTPSVDPDTIDMGRLGGSDADTLEHFPVKVERIPMEVSQCLDGAVGETMNHIEGDHISIKSAYDRPAAFRAIIECQEVFKCSHNLFKGWVVIKVLVGTAMKVA